MTQDGENKMSLDDRLKRVWSWILGFVVLGMLDSAWILVLHFSHEKLAPACGISDTVNCNVLEVAKYSEWFGIPVAFFSLIFYSLALCLGLWGRKQARPAQFRPVLYLWFMSFLAVGSTVYMLAISIGILKTLCVYCSVLYVVSLGLMVNTWRAKNLLSQPWWHLFTYDVKHAHKSRWFWGTTISVLSLLGLALVVVPKISSNRPSMNGDKVNIASVDKRTLGSPSAPISIVVFSDFECPACKGASRTLEDLAEELKGEIKVTYKFFPLDLDCNRIMQRPMHQESCRGARASYCASKQDRFWLFHDLIYANQKDLSEAKFFDFAREVNLDLPAFRRCLRAEESLKVVQDDVEEGIALSLRGTPSTFINGQKYEGPMTLSALIEALGIH